MIIFLIIVAAITVADLCTAAYMHGKPKEMKFNFWWTLGCSGIQWVILLALLNHWGLI